MKFYDDYLSFKRMLIPATNLWGILLFRFRVIRRVTTEARSKRYVLMSSNDAHHHYLQINDLVFRCDTRAHFNDALHLVLDNIICAQYNEMPVGNKVVIDIGAAIGDTAIAFVFYGAKHVYAYEPQPSTFKMAEWNIANNKLGDKVTLFNEAVSDKKSKIRLSESDKVYGLTELKKSDWGKEIPITTLKEIVARHKIKNGCLKIDVEGYEYPIILGSSKSTLRKFSHIILEYQDYSQRLKDKLELVGFEVKVYPSNDVYYKNTPDKLGLIFATRR